MYDNLSEDFLNETVKQARSACTAQPCLFRALVPTEPSHRPICSGALPSHCGVVVRHAAPHSTKASIGPPLLAPREDFRFLARDEPRRVA